jgi:signal peptidase II
MEKKALKRHALFWLLAGGGTALDLASKSAVFAWLGGPQECRPRSLLGELVVLRTAHNTGTFFGMGSEHPWFNTGLIVFTVVMTAVIVYMYVAPPRESGERRALYTAALALVFAGALGNLYDRVVHDRVRDFLDIGLSASRRWPTFNLADTWLVVGVGLYLVALMRMKRAPGEEAGPAGTAPGAAAAGAAPGADGTAGDE